MTIRFQGARLAVIAAAVMAVVAHGWTTSAQAPAAAAPRPVTAPEAIVANSYPNPFVTTRDFFKMPTGRKWGSTAGVDIDKDGKTVWIIDRCGGNSCYDAAAGKMSDLDPILHFDENGKLIKSFGAGLIVFPHGIGTDRDGNVWVTDGNDNRPTTGRAGRGAAGAAGGAAADTTAGGAPAAGGGAGRGRGAAAGAAGGAPAAGGGAGRGRGAATAGAAGGGAPAAGGGAAAAGGGGAGRGTAAVGAAAGATKGHQVFKFSPNGTLLLTLGKAGGAAEPDYFYQPNDVLVAPNGDIFVGETHGGGGGLIYKFDKTGKFLMKWGHAAIPGTTELPRGELNQPHTLAMDSKGRLFVGSRSCNCVQIFDQNGTFIDQWTQFSRPSGVFIDKNDMLYVADSESGPSNNTTHPGGWQRGIRIGSAADGRVKYLIPDPDLLHSGTSSAEGVAVDNKGTIYGAEVGQMAVKKYVKE